MYGVTALCGSDAWAAGASARSGGVQHEPLAWQWNGQRWRSATVPGVTGYYLPDVAASAKANLWIFAVPGNGGDAKAVRWDRTQWQDIPLPAGVYPNDVAVLKADGCLGGGPAAAPHRQWGRTGVPDHPVSLGRQRVVPLHPSHRGR